MRASRGMGAIAPSKVPRAKRRGDSQPVIGTGRPIKTFGGGGSISRNGKKTADIPSDAEIRAELRRRGLKSEPGLQSVYPEAFVLGGPGVGTKLARLGKRALERIALETSESEGLFKTPAEKIEQTIRRAGTEKAVEEKARGGRVKSKVNEAGNYTKPGMREGLFKSIKARAVQGTKAGQWSARKAQLLAKQYKAKGGGYRD